MCRERGERPSEAYQSALPRHSRDNGKPEFSVLPYDWIPACAGMTGEVSAPAPRLPHFREDEDGQV